jgi:hypothetical protein
LKYTLLIIKFNLMKIEFNSPYSPQLVRKINMKTKIFHEKEFIFAQLIIK